MEASRSKYIRFAKYAALNVFLGIAFYALFLYLESVQGGGYIMGGINPLLTFGLIATSSLLTTVSVYSIKNSTGNHAKTNGTAASIGTLIMGTGLCGCNTTFPALIAAALGVSSTGVYALSSFLKNYGTDIISAAVVLNILVITYYVDRLSRPRRKKRA